MNHEPGRKHAKQLIKLYLSTIAYTFQKLLDTPQCLHLRREARERTGNNKRVNPQNYIAFHDQLDIHVKIVHWH